MIPFAELPPLVRRPVLAVQLGPQGFYVAEDGEQVSPIFHARYKAAQWLETHR